MKQISQANQQHRKDAELSRLTVETLRTKLTKKDILNISNLWRKYASVAKDIKVCGHDMTVFQVQGYVVALDYTTPKVVWGKYDITTVEALNARVELELNATKLNYSNFKG